MELFCGIIGRNLNLIGFIVISSLITLITIGYYHWYNQNPTEKALNNQTTTIFQNNTEVSIENTTETPPQKKGITTEFL